MTTWASRNSELIAEQPNKSQLHVSSLDARDPGAMPTPHPELTRWLIMCLFSWSCMVMQSNAGWQMMECSPPPVEKPPTAKGMMLLEGEESSGTTVTTNETEATEEITALARALQYNPKLIYEYVRNHIAYDPPTYGLANGANGCLLAGRGNDWDQAALLVSLLRVSGFNTRFVRGVVEYSRSDLAKCLGVPQNKIAELLGNGGHFFSEYPASCEMYRMWVEAEIEGTWYTFDPSFKEYQDIAGIDLAAAMGYTQASFLASAAEGATVSNDYVQNINGTNIETLLTTYTTNLLKHIRTYYPNSKTDEIISGRRLVSQTLTNYSTELPYALSAEVLDTYDHLPDANNITVSISHCGLSHSFKGYEIAGKRVSIFYATNDFRPELRLDGQLIATGNVTTAGMTNDLVVSYSHPYARDSDGEGTNTFRVVSGSKVVLVLDFVGASPRLLAKQDKELQRSTALGMSDNSEAVSGGRLQVTATAGLIQWIASESLLASVAGVRGFSHQHTGLIYEQYGGGCVIDLPALVVSSAGSSESKTAWFQAGAFFSSALEHGCWEQSQGATNEFGSTAKLLKVSNGQGKKTYYATSNNWESVEPLLTNYHPGLIASIENNILSNGYSYLLPEDGQIEFGEWAGAGFVSADSAHGAMGMLVSGGYEGGISGWKQQTVNGVVVQTTVYFTSGLVVNYAGVPSYPLSIGTAPGPNAVAQGAASSSYQNLLVGPANQTTSADPVDLQTGESIYRHSDLALGGPEPRGLNFARTYQSGMNHNNAGLGYGWTHRYNVSIRDVSDGKLGFGYRQPSDAVALIVQSYVCQDLLKNQTALSRDWVINALAATWAMDQLVGNAAVVCMGDVSEEHVRMPDGSYVAPPGETASLHKQNGGYVLERRFGQVMTFDTNGLISAWQDADTNEVTFTYTTSNRLDQVSDAFGRTLTFSYSSGLVASVADSSGRTVGFEYSNGNLVSATDPESYETVYTYDTNNEHLLTAIHDPGGELIASNNYNSLGKVESQLFGSGNTWNFFISGFRGVEENPQGELTIHYFDENGWNVGTEDMLSNRVSRFYDGQGHVVRIVDAKGGTTLLSYDANHNPTNIVDAMTNTTTLRYDQYYRMVSVRDALGNVSSNEYDGEHHLVRTTDALGHSTDIAYYDSGLVQTITDPRENVTTYTYASNGLPHTVQRTDGGTITNEFSACGDLQAFSDANGHTTRFTYDKRRLLTGVRDAADNTVSNVYDDAGRLIRVIDARENPRCFSYTPTMYELKSITNADGGVVQLRYDSREWLVSSTDPLEHVTSNRYDAAGRVIAVVDALGHVVGLGYDQNGNAVSITNQLGKAWTKSYDALNRLVAWADPLGHSNIVEYDALGRVAASTDANGLRTEYTYDAVGRRTSQVHPDRARESFEYDPVGNLTAFMNGKGQRTTFTYDGMNRRLSETNAEGHGITFAYDAAGNIVSRRDANGATTQYGYNEINSLTNILYPDSSTVVYQYDANRNLSSVSSANSVVTYAYDVMNRILASTTRVSGVESVVSYRYDLNGNRVSITYPGGLVVSNVYDQLNRLAAVKDWGGRETHYGYDDASSPTGMLYPNGVKGMWTWDDARRLTELAYVGATTAFIDRVFTRDAIGNRMQEEILAGLAPTLQPKVERMSFDQADRLREVLAKTTPNDAAWTTNNYTFDPNGNLISNLTGLAFSYDYDNKATNVMMEGYTTRYAYDGLGNRIKRTVNGTNYIDVLDRGAALPNVLVELNESGEPVRYFVWGLTLIAQIETNGAVYYAHADELGSTLALTDTNGAIVAEYTYSPYGEILDHTGTVDTPYTFVGGYGAWHDGAGLYHMKARLYSAELRRFTTTDPIGLQGGLNLYVYGSDNPLAFLDPFGLCQDAPWSGYKWLYTGNGYASDADYQAAVASAGDYIYDNSGVRGVVVGAGKTWKKTGKWMPAVGGGVSGTWTIDDGFSSSVDFGFGLQQRGNVVAYPKPAGNALVSDAIGVSRSYTFYAQDSSKTGWSGLSVAGGQSNTRGGAAFSADTRGNQAVVALTIGYVYVGLVVDARVVDNVTDSYGAITAWFR